jgi:5-oxoprolinase (ATP-hydrolysing) subunit A
MIKNPEVAAERILRILSDRALTSLGGKKVPLKRIDSVCVHGDEPGAVDMATAIRKRLREANVQVVPLHKMDIGY